MFMRFTEKGLANVQQSPDRAAAFHSTAEKAEVKVEMLCWTTGPYDGVIVLDALDKTTAAGVVLGLAKAGTVSTCMLRAFDADEVRAVLGKAR